MLKILACPFSKKPSMSQSRKPTSNRLVTLLRSWQLSVLRCRITIYFIFLICSALGSAFHKQEYLILKYIQFFVKFSRVLNRFKQQFSQYSSLISVSVSESLSVCLCLLLNASFPVFLCLCLCLSAFSRSEIKADYSKYFISENFLSSYNLSSDQRRLNIKEKVICF